ncbi:hypothetical protein NQD34_018271 [Periophthalmus magnuspinnatus]|nr:cyclin-G2-like [Periophthalmus magnuspinnatus]KAI9999378.1 hypothetical protein NQD34_018271 [Periophthalmus magnuspinnatus]
MDPVRLLKELKATYDQEELYLPKEAGLNLIEATQDSTGVSAKSRDSRVKDLLSLTRFFGYSTQTFVLAVNLLDRFLAMIRVRPKHLSCVGLGCLHLAAKACEQQCDVTPGEELIRISQSGFTLSDLSRMEAIIMGKLQPQHPTVTAATFLQLYHQITLAHCTHRRDILSLEKLEAQLKACLCRLSFSKAKPSVLALSLLIHEVETIQSDDMLEVATQIQRHLKIHEAELRCWGEQVARCLSVYASAQCTKPNHRSLQWVISRRTAHTLHSSRTVPELPTIPESAWDHSSEDSDTLSSGEESICSAEEPLS